MVSADLPTCLVSSGKGGCGKTTSSAIAARWLAGAGYRVGYLDGDLRDPNLPQVLRLNGELDGIRAAQKQKGAHPYYYKFPDGPIVPTYSSAFLYAPDRGIRMSGAQIQGMVREFLHTVTWPELDLLVVDVDPSAGDSITAIRDSMRHVAAILITEDDPSTISDCGRQKDAYESMAIHGKKEPIEVLGVVGNRLGYTGIDEENHEVREQRAREEEANIRAHALEWGLPYLGGLPIRSVFRTDSLKAIETVGAPLGKVLADVVGRWARGAVA